MQCSGSDDMIALISTNLPAIDRNFAAQPASLEFSLCNRSRNKRASSAYKRHGLMLLKGSRIAPICANLWRYLAKKSMAKMKIDGESGSPCRTPRLRFDHAIDGVGGDSDPIRLVKN